MQSHTKRALAILLALVIGIFGCMAIAHGIQTDHGNVAVSMGSITLPEGDLTYKLYVPNTATEETPAPGVLLLHGKVATLFGHFSPKINDSYATSGTR